MRPNKGPPILLQTDEDFFYESLGQKKREKSRQEMFVFKVWYLTRAGDKKMRKNTSEEMNLRRVLRICVRY